MSNIEDFRKGMFEIEVKNSTEADELLKLINYNGMRYSTDNSPVPFKYILLDKKKVFYRFKDGKMVWETYAISEVINAEEFLEENRKDIEMNNPLFSKVIEAKLWVSGINHDIFELELVTNDTDKKYSERKMSLKITEEEAELIKEKLNLEMNEIPF